MGKTKGVYVDASFKHKIDTDTKRFGAYVEGKWEETTATKAGGARGNLKYRYNKRNNRQPGAFVNIEGLREVKPKAEPEPFQTPEPQPEEKKVEVTQPLLF